MKSVLVVGLGRFGTHLILHLNSLGHDILAIDTNEERVEAVLPYVTSAQIGDCTNEQFVKSIGVDNFDVCYCCIGDNFQCSLETTTMLKDCGANYVVARASQEIQEKFLLRNGADRVVYPEREHAKWAAIRYTSNNLLDYVDLKGDSDIFEVLIPEKWVGKSIIDLDVRRKYNLNILSIGRNGEKIMSIDPSMTFESGDSVLVFGLMKDVHKCFKI